MLYEIVNPSDAYTLEAAEFKHAAAAILLLGQGKYGLTPETGDQDVPLFLLGGYDDWAKEINFDLNAVLNDELEHVGEVLESVLIGNFRDRIELKDAMSAMNPEKARAYREAWVDRRRSSMNNIGAAAKQIAERIREKLAATAGVKA